MGLAPVTYGNVDGVSYMCTDAPLPLVSDTRALMPSVSIPTVNSLHRAAQYLASPSSIGCIPCCSVFSISIKHQLYTVLLSIYS